MKRFLSSLLALILTLNMIPVSLAAGSEAQQAADALNSMGLFSGTGTDADGKPIYELDRAPTRHEAITMLVKLLGKQDDAAAGNWELPFTDVADWARPFVGYAYANGLTSGTSETTFGGNSPITVSQYLTFVLRTLGYEVGTDFAWDRAWELSDKILLTDGRYNAETATFTRGDVAIISHRALSAQVIRKATDSAFQIHFIDVGQADSALVICDGKSMLIDGGNVADSRLIYSYLDAQNITHLDYIVATHVHEDHVGGLAAALNFATADTAFCSATEHNSEAFGNFTGYLSKQGVQIEIPQPGFTFELGSASVQILGPIVEDDDPNNMSIVLRIEYGDTSFLFTGDAERSEEEDILAAGYELSSTVLKVGHHGSENATTYPFLREVMPEYAVISVGTDNSYGHPTDAALSRLTDAGVTVYRTDLIGHIICTSDGTSVCFSIGTHNTDTGFIPAPIPDPAPNPDPEAAPSSDMVWIPETGSKYHSYSGCSNMDNPSHVSLSSAQELGFTPCSRCYPDAVEEEPIYTPEAGNMVWIPQSGSKYHSYSGCSNMKTPSQVSKAQAQALGYTPCKRCY